LKIRLRQASGNPYQLIAQAWGYNEIKNSKADTFIMLGLSHGGYPSSLSLMDFETPLGIVKNDAEFQELLSEAISVNEDAHANEHSIEVQIPFLQYVHRNPKIAPIIASSDIHQEKLAELIFDAIEKTKRKVIVIASSDFTHYGLNYGYFPFQDNVKENMYKLDKKAIELIILGNQLLGYWMVEFPRRLRKKKNVMPRIKKRLKNEADIKMLLQKKYKGVASHKMILEAMAKTGLYERSIRNIIKEIRSSEPT